MSILGQRSFAVIVVVAIVTLAALAVPTHASGSGEAQTASAPANRVILDETGYFREYDSFGLPRLNGDVLRSEGQRLFGPKLAVLERNVKRMLKDKGYDWNTTDWRDVAVCCFQSSQMYGAVSSEEGALSAMPTVPPPADWARPGFDDSDFVRQHRGVAAWNCDWNYRECSTMYRRAIYLRSYFEVPDVAKARDLSLTIAYRGGIRVLVNGKEIARKDLLDGELGPEAYAADYPLAAYQAEADEIPAKRNPLFTGDLRCRYEQAPQDTSQKDYHVTYARYLLNRKGWERLMKIRDRELGPLPIPSTALRKGSNVLAIELRASRLHPAVAPDKAYGTSMGWGAGIHGWDHARLLRLELQATGGSVPSALRRPPGFQAWAADMHDRLFDRDFNPAGWPTGHVRLVGGQNGSYSAQIGIGSDKDVGGLKVTCSELTGPGGGEIPADAVRVQPLAGHGFRELSFLGSGRSYEGPRAWATMSTLWQWGDRETGPYPQGVTDRAKYTESFRFFDHITSDPITTVPADSCQPFWLTLKVPAAAPPGHYSGKVTVHADGQPAISVPIQAEVIGWRVPDPQTFQTFAQSEQSPYAVAKHYKAELWSEEHYRLIETSFAQLARIGCRWVMAPVVLNSECGNRGDSPIRWIRKKDGSFSFDYSRLDRYLALAGKHLGKPEVVCFVVMHGADSKAVEVNVFDEETGHTEVMDVGPDNAQRKPLWKAFAVSLHEHMKSLGLAQSMYWGLPYDMTPDLELLPLLAEVVPEVSWTKAAHGAYPEPAFPIVSNVYGQTLPAKSRHGWKNPYVFLLTTRLGGSVICVDGCAPPFPYRVMCDRALQCGFRGLGRVGADYFDNTWYDGCKASHWNMVGRSIVQTLWPGKTGVESGARNEAFLEGLQEAEIRIFLEQAIERKIIPEALAKEAEAVLDEHFAGTAFIDAGDADVQMQDFSAGWRVRSTRMYETAAKVAAAVGMDTAEAAFGQATQFQMTWGDNTTKRPAGKPVAVPVLGRTALQLTLRNWTSRPRAWKASASEPWMVPSKKEGSVMGQQALPITLDGMALKEGQEMTGTLTVTDVSTGAAYPVEITVKAVKGMVLNVMTELDFSTGGGSGAGGFRTINLGRLFPVFTVPVGQSESREYFLSNRTAGSQKWEISSSHESILLEPASGKIAAGASIPVKVTARPKENQNAIHDATLTLTAADGAVKETYPIKVYVVASQMPPVPAGEVVYLSDLDKKYVKSHCLFGFDGTAEKNKRARPWWYKAPNITLSGFCGNWPGISRTQEEDAARHTKDGGYKTLEEQCMLPFNIAGKKFNHGLWVVPLHETVYSVEGAGFSAFVAEVGFSSMCKQPGKPVNCEIYVDGQLRAQSGLVKAGDPPRLLVVDSLGQAQEVRLVTRRDDLSDDGEITVTWADARFIKVTPEAAKGNKQ